MKYTERVKIKKPDDFKEAFGFAKSDRTIKSFFHINSKEIVRFIMKGVLIFLILYFLVVSVLINSYSRRIYKNLDDVESHQFGIVFGPGITEDAVQDDILRDRVLTAVDLYKDGKIQTILISGESRYANFSETKKMREILVQNNIPEYAILEDGESGRTFETCLRAKKVYKINKAILITQEFHLPRALYLCNSFGIESHGFIADRGLYEQLRIYYLREGLALIQSVLDINYTRPFEYDDLIEN